MSAFHRSSCLLVIGFIAGSAFSFVGVALGRSGPALIAPSNHSYIVSLSEIKQSFVFADTVAGSYTHAVRMSDGSIREITLRPVTKNGVELVALSDKSANGTVHSLMGPNGTTTDGKLMIDVKDHAELLAQLKLVRNSEL